MREIPLTRGKVALVGDTDYLELSKYKWYAKKAGNIFYAVRNSPTVGGKRCQIRMHAAIAGIPPKGMETDHINGNGLDNRRENLRVVTTRENQQNRHMKKSSRFPGVSWEEWRQKWKAQIAVNRKNHNLGRYNSEEAAARRYRIACDWQVMHMELYSA